MKSQWRDKEEGFTNGSKMKCRQDQVDLINNAVFGHLADLDEHGFADNRFVRQNPTLIIVQNHIEVILGHIMSRSMVL